MNRIVRTELGELTLKNNLKEIGFKGSFLLTRSGSGSMTFDEASERPFETIMSGPVAGAEGAGELSRKLKNTNMVTADVGGTSFDTCLILDGRPQIQFEGKIVGLPLQSPWVDVRSIGAGGGSIAYLDEGGLLRSGPQSAGAVPGPACYGRGGNKPTTTDAAFYLGMLGEKLVRKSLEKIPDGKYSGFGQMDSNGVDEGEVKFKISIEVKGSDLILDFTEAPKQQNGPINSPLPSTVSKARVAFSMMAGNGEQPNEGFFRPLTVKTKKGSMFNPVSPAPCFLNGWPGLQVIELIYKLLSDKLPEAFPASSGGCLIGAVWWGIRNKDGEPWADGAPHPVGQGGFSTGDGITTMHHNSAGTRMSPSEIWESKNPWLIKKIELIWCIDAK